MDEYRHSYDPLLGPKRAPGRARPSGVRRGSIAFDVADLRTAGATMLGVAAVLPLLPDHGFSCPFRALTGVPCPLCGMTTSVEATVHGDLGAAVAATPAGIVAVGIAIWILLRPPKALRVPTPVAIFGLGVMWVFQLIRFGSSPL